MEVRGFGFRVLQVRVSRLVSRFWVSSYGSGVSGAVFSRFGVFEVWGIGFAVFEVWGFGFGVSRLWFEVSSLGVKGFGFGVSR